MTPANETDKTSHRSHMLRLTLASLSERNAAAAQLIFRSRSNTFRADTLLLGLLLMSQPVDDIEMSSQHDQDQQCMHQYSSFPS